MRTAANHGQPARGACLPAAMALAGLVVAGCSSAPYPQGPLEKLFPDSPRPVLRAVATAGHVLQLAEMQGQGRRPILFVHGAPGDWQAWARYLDDPALRGYGPLIAVDRPGYGGSSPGIEPLALRAQAALLAAALPPGHPVIVVAHSLGGPIAAWLVLDHPDQVCGAVLVAPAIDPALESPRWYHRLADTWLMRRLLSRRLIYANREILALPAALPALEAAWPQLRRPVVVVQGGRDELVAPETADYAEQHVPARWLTVRRLPSQGHFLPWQQPDAVIEAIRSLPCGG